MKQKVLIVKLGFSETIDHQVSQESVSLGDIFRTTTILHLFKNDDVTWLTAEKGAPLLCGNPYIKRVLIYNLTTVLQLQKEYFDVLINLEKIPGICALTDSITAWRRYGFRFDARRGIAEAYEGAYEALANSDDPKLRRRMKKNWIELLYEMVGAKWRGESYVLGYRPKTRESFDIGFNTNVGKKWKNKFWSTKRWKELEKIIGNRYTVSYQQSLNDIYGYIDWINSCRLLVTNDSLGLHLAIALKKKIIALFGPTSEKEIYLFNLGKTLKPEKRLLCMPCFMTKCRYKKSCIDEIQPEVVFKHIQSLLK